MKMKLILTVALLTVLATATFNSPRVVLADGGPILVCPPGKTHDQCTKNNPLPPGGGVR